VCQVLPSGPGFENDNNLKLFVAPFYAARPQITIATPYFVPDECLMIALTSAAQPRERVKVYLIGPNWQWNTNSEGLAPICEICLPFPEGDTGQSM
jgi:phosphatidylserine/phosphatidylglycerophosphate/cardiolipin synthase-like enzyme